MSACLAGPVAPAGAVVSNTPDPTAQFNSSVSAIVQAGSRVMVGGAFSRAGTPTSFGADVSATSGASNPVFARPDGAIQHVISDGAGGWYVAGVFTRVGGVPRGSLAHLLSTGALDPAFDAGLDNGGGSAAVTDMRLSGSTLYVAGVFTSVKGVARTNIAAVDAATGAPTSFVATTNGGVNALALSADGTKLYVGGRFTTAGSPATARRRLAAFDATTGALDTTFNPNVDPQVLSTTSGVDGLAVSGSDVYLAGNFTTVNSNTQANTRPGLAAVSATTGTIDSAFNAGVASGDVKALAVSGTTLYLGGLFTTVNGGSVLRNHLAAVSTATGVATGFDPNVDDIVSAVAVSGTTVFFGGAFNNVGPASRHKAAAVDATTGLPTSFDPNVDTTVNAIAAAGGRVYLGGNFRFAGADTIHNGLVALNADGSVDQAFQPDLRTANGVFGVLALATAGGKVYVGGAFDTVNGAARANIAAVDATTGATDAAFNPGADAAVRALQISGSTLYAGGDFLTAGGAARTHAAAFNATTGAVTGFDPSVGIAQAGLEFQPVRALTVSATRVYIGGVFTSAGGVTRNRLAAFDPATGAVDPSFNPNVDGAVQALLISGNTLYAGGDFFNVGATATGNLAALDTATGAVNTSFDPKSRGRVRGLALIGNTLYVAQNDAPAITTTPPSAIPTKLAAVDATTGVLDPAFAPAVDANTQLRVLTASGTHLYAGGIINTVDGAERLNFAQFTGAATVPPVATTGAASAITDTGATIAGTVNPGGAPVTWTVEYGTSTTFGANTPFASAGSGTADVPVSAVLSGLTPDTTYFYRVVAKDAGGTSFFGTVKSFDTGPGGAPLVTTGAASAITNTSATIAGTVNPHGARTAFTIEYGTTTGFGAISAVDNIPGGTGSRAVSLPLSGLTADTTYLYRVVATNAAGSTVGAVSSFTTGPGGAPVVSTGAASAITGTGATLSATVNPRGTATAYTFEFGTTTSFGSLSAIDRIPAGGGARSVSLPLSGLTPGTTYLFRVVATNATGTAMGDVHSFTTPGAA